MTTEQSGNPEKSKVSARLGQPGRHRTDKTILVDPVPTTAEDGVGVELPPGPVGVRLTASEHAEADARVIGDLGERAARGAAVTLAGQVTRILLQTVTVVVLARLLSPRDYGLLAMVLVIVGIGEIFRDFGLSNAAIQAKSLSRAQRDNLMWVNTGIGLVLTAIVFLSAPLVALAFHQPALVPITRVLALTFTINGLATQYRAGLNRKMRFGYLSICDIAGQAGSLVIAVSFAALGAGYWSLVAQQLSQLGIATIMMIVLAGWLPRRPGHGGDVRPFLRFGGQLAATQCIYYLSSNLDTITVGVRFGSNSLGIYNRGFSLLMSPLNSLRSPATTVALPVLSRLQDDVVKAGDYIRRSQLTLGYTIVAGLSITVGAAYPIVALLLGRRWLEVAPVLAFLAISGACSTLAYVGLWVYLSRGLGKDLMRYTMVTLCLQAVCILGGSRWGVVGVAAGYATASALEWPLSLCWLSRRTVIPLRSLLEGATRVTLCGIVAGGAAHLASLLTTREIPAISAALCVVSGALAYAILGTVVPAVRQDLMVVRGFMGRMVRR